MGKNFLLILIMIQNIAYLSKVNIEIKWFTFQIVIHVRPNFDIFIYVGHRELAPLPTVHFSSNLNFHKM